MIALKTKCGGPLFFFDFFVKTVSSRNKSHRRDTRTLAFLVSPFLGIISRLKSKLSLNPSKHRLNMAQEIFK